MLPFIALFVRTFRLELDLAHSQETACCFQNLVRFCNTFVAQDRDTWLPRSLLPVNIFSRYINKLLHRSKEFAEPGHGISVFRQREMPFFNLALRRVPRVAEELLKHVQVEFYSWCRRTSEASGSSFDGMIDGMKKTFSIRFLRSRSTLEAVHGAKGRCQLSTDCELSSFK